MLMLMRACVFPLVSFDGIENEEVFINEDEESESSSKKRKRTSKMEKKEEKQKENEDRTKHVCLH